MSEIKVFKTPLIQSDTTDSEKRALYEKWKKSSTNFESYVWDSWLNLEIKRSEPIKIIKNNIISVQIKNLLKYATPIVDFKEEESTGDIWLQSDHDIRAVDISLKEYRIPQDIKFKIIGLNFWWRKHNGQQTTLPAAHQNSYQICSNTEILDAGTYSDIWPKDHNVLTASVITPIPFDTTISSIKITKDTKAEELDVFIDEINLSNDWYQKNQNLLYREPIHIAVPSVLVWPLIKPAASGLADPWLSQIQNSVSVNFKLDSISQNYIIADLSQVDILDMYHRYRLLSIRNPIVTANIAKIEKQFQEKRLLKKQKFDSQKLNRDETFKNFIALEVYKRGYLELNVKERTQVDLLVKNKLKKYEKSNQADQTELRNLLLQIHKAFESSVTDTFQMKKVADVLSKSKVKSLVCGHIQMMVKETLKARPSSLGQIDTQAITQSIVQVWAERVPVNYKYYCKNCGELLMTEDLEDFIVFNQNIITSTSDKDIIWTYILFEVSQVVRRIKFIGKAPPNNKAFVTAIAATMEPEMVKIQSELQKSKTKSLEDISHIMILYISAFSYAMLAKLIIDQPKYIQWVTTVAAGNKYGGKPQPEALKTLNMAYSMLIDANQNKISKIKDFGVEQMKPILLKGYEWARNAKFQTKSKDESEADIPSMWVSQIVNDPWYNLIYDLASIHGDVAYTDFTKLLGVKNPNDALCSLKPFEHAWRPTTKTDLENHVFQGYLNAIDYVDQRIFMEIAIPKSPLLHQWEKKWEFLAVKDRENDLQLRDFALRPTKIMYNNVSGQVPMFPHLDISLVKCPTGEVHDFSFKNAIYIYTADPKKQYMVKELSKSDVRNGIKSLTLKDELCGNCHMSRHAKPNTAVATKLSRSLEQDNFYKYFEHRCPVKPEELHDFTLDKDGFIGKSPCKRCGYVQNYMFDKPASYYEKWKAKMPKRDKHKTIVLSDTFKVKADWQPAKNEKWNVSLTSILQISNISNIPYNLWINLGLSEHKNFNQLRLSKINPQSTIDDITSSARLIKLTNYVYWVYKQYMLVKNHSRVTLPLGLKMILEEDTSIIALHQTLNTMMPPLLTDFQKKLDYYNFGIKMSTKVVCNFVLHTLCNLLLQIRGLDKIKKLAYKLFDYLVQQIMMSESMMSELEINKTLIVKSDAVDEALDDEDNEEYLNAGEAVDAEEKGNEDPFSLDESDIETTNTGNDDEEFMS